MKIIDITSRVITIPLTTPFKTALRSIDAVENIIVTVLTDTGQQGFGGAAPTAVITGETLSSIKGGIELIRTSITGMDVFPSESIFQRLNSCIVGNYSAKAAVDMAIYDLIAKSHDIPLYRLLGGQSQPLETDITISLDSLEKMVSDSRQRLAEGFRVLKIKVGGDPQLDIRRLEGITAAVGQKALLRIDANQGWNCKEAVAIAKELERSKMPIELIEQPVKADDYQGLRFVRENVSQPVYADESIFTTRDALQLVSMNAVDGINIKLMKCGGIYNALKIAAIAESAGIPCMIGSMMESHVSVTAAAHLAASRNIISRFDLDAPIFCSRNPAQGGISYKGSKVCLPETPGLGIQSIED